MNIRNHQWITHGVIVLAVLLAALFIVSPVHAEGEPPAQPAPSGEVTVSEPAQPAAEDKAEVAPAPATPEIVPTTVDTTTETAPAPDTAPAATEPVVVAAPSDVSAPAATELTAETPSTADLPKADVAAPVVAEEVKTPTTADIVQQASATNTLLVGEDGQLITLASAESVSALAAGDPYFTAGGTTYNFATISDALNYIVAHNLLPTDRKVYVNSGTYNEDAWVDGTSSPLGLLNGLIGVSGSEVTIVNGGIYIGHTTGGFTLSGFTVSGPVDFYNNTGALTLTDLDISNPKGDGLVVTAHKGSVTLKNVSSHDNKGRGALIQNNTTVVAPVTITSSSFDYNDTYFDEGSGPVYHAGLEVESKGIVTLDGVSASYNDGDGADLGEFGSLLVKISIFDGNNAVGDPFHGDGLSAGESDAAPVALDNVQAFHNGGVAGILLVNKGNVLVSNAELRWNSGYGLYIYNSHGLATATVSVINSTFVDNSYDGLVVFSKGNILLNTIDAEFNGHDGVYLDNCIWNSGTKLCDGSGTITLTSSVSGPDNELDNSGIYGIQAYSRNAVTLANFHVYANKIGGIYIDNGQGNGFGGVTLNVTMPNFQNDIDGYDMWLDSNVTQTGLYVNSKGAISVSMTRVADNLLDGAELYNNTSAGAIPVTITQSSFGNNGQNGLLVLSEGNILLNTIDVEFNGADGVYLDNCLLNKSTNLCDGSGTITLTSSVIGPDNELDNSGIYGIEAYSRNAVTLANFHVYANKIGGIYIDNGEGNGFGGVTINVTMLNFQNDIDGYDMWLDSNVTQTGLYVNSKGAISVSMTRVADNLLDGAELYNNTSAGAIPVTITQSSFGNNGQNGLVVWSKGAITVTNAEANGNGGFGAELLNSGSSSFLPVSVTNATFNNNNNIGLRILSKGAITLNGVQSTGNDLTFYYIEDPSGETVKDYLSPWASQDEWMFTAPSSADMTIGLDSLDFDTYLQVWSGGSLIAQDDDSGGGGNALLTFTPVAGQSYVIYVTANGGGSGEYTLEVNVPTQPIIYGYAAGAVLENKLGNGTVTILNNPTRGYGARFTGNNGGGLWINASGAVTLNNVWSNENTLYGVRVFSKGSITWNGGSANGNQHSNGASLINSFAVLPSAVSVSGVDFNGNMGGDGLDVSSKGAVSLTNINASDNTADASDPTWPAYGVSLDNTSGSLPMAVTISATAGKFCNFDYNQGYGMDIGSRGLVSLTNIIGSGNGSTGANIDNTAGVNGGVTLTNAYFDENFTAGLVVHSNGAIVWTNGSARQNMTEGGVGLLNAGSSTTPGVTVSNVDCSGNQGGQGLFVLTKGAIVVTNLTANGNTGDPGDPYPPFSGAFLWNDLGTAPVTVTATAGKTCDFNNNTEYGLQIHSKGAVTLSGINALRNGSGGAEINNSGAATALPVSITNGNFNYNAGTGLSVLSRGNILLTNVNAEGNSLSYGEINVKGETVYEHLAIDQSMDVWHFNGKKGQDVSIELNGYGYGFSPVVYLYDQSNNLLAWNNNVKGDAAITLDFTLPDDGDYTIAVTSRFIVSGYYQLALNDPKYDNQTPENMAFGAYLDNCLWTVDHCVGSGLVTITNTTSKNFSGNNTKGLAIFSQGAISVTNVNVNYNGDMGGSIENNYAGSAPLTLTNAYFDENAAVGMEAHSRGTITWNNGSASGNGFDPNASNLGGAGLINSWATSAMGVTLSNVSCDNNQGDDGLYIYTNGAVLLTNVTASGNSGGNGAEIHNNVGSLPSVVTISATAGKYCNFNMNGINGLLITSKGNVNLTRINTSFNNNNGIDVDTRGNITLTALQAIYNRARGVTLNNDYSGFTGSILLLGAPGENQFLHNGHTGFYASAKLGITLNNLVADWNGSDGVFLTSSTAGAAINIFTASLRNNTSSGLGIFGHGAVTLNFVTSLRNGTDGVNLNSYGPLTILNSAFVGNVGSGIEAVPHGFFLALISTSYYGNDTDHSGDRNLYIH